MIEQLGWNWVLLKQTNVLTKKPCYIGGIVVSPNESKRCNVHIYDSVGEVDNEIIHIGTSTGTSNSVMFPYPLKVNNGIYVTLDGDTSDVFILYNPDPLHKSDVKE